MENPELAATRAAQKQQQKQAKSEQKTNKKQTEKTKQQIEEDEENERMQEEVRRREAEKLRKLREQQQQQNEHQEEESEFTEEVEVEDEPGVWRDTPSTTQMWQLINSGDHAGVEEWLGRDPNIALIRAQDGRGPLFWAYETNDEHLIKLFENLGASSSDKDANGLTPKDLQP